jgi:uncharacterized membrane-anchored protein
MSALPGRPLAFAALLAFPALLLLCAVPAFPASPASPASSAGSPAADSTLTGSEAPLDSATQAAMRAAAAVEKSLTYQSGEIKLGDGLATARLPEGYRFLDPEQSAKVLTDLWGNPPGPLTLGMIFPPDQSPLADDSWAVIITFDEDGYVKDDDAEKIDYDDLFKDMKAGTEENNKERAKEGYPPLHLIGWAEKPHYDKASNKLYWAKELRFGESDENTLNYNVRALGRRGVLVLNAVSGMGALDKVKVGMQALKPVVEFDAGHRYAEFDPKIDKVAAYGIAGLVAGTVLAKGGMLKVLIAAIIAGKKFVILGVVGIGALLAKYLRGRSEERKVVRDEVKRVG